jgi:hypothetical protein
MVRITFRPRLRLISSGKFLFIRQNSSAGRKRVKASLPSVILSPLRYRTAKAVDTGNWNNPSAGKQFLVNWSHASNWPIRPTNAGPPRQQPAGGPRMGVRAKTRRLTANLR